MPAADRRILLIDRDATFATSIRSVASRSGLAVTAARSMPRAEALLASTAFDAIVMEPGIARSPREAADWLAQHRDRAPVLIVAAHLSVASAVVFMRGGARDCLVKPCDPHRLVGLLDALAATNAQTGEPGEALAAFEGASDPSMQALLQALLRVADTAATVLLTGETGTGKSRFARAIHDSSPRRGGPFVTLSCGAIVPALAGSELFGHVRGAFSDATHDTPGRLGAAQGGTLLLDDVDVAPPELQCQLLHVLQERCYEPVGSNQTQRADVRVLATSNADLAALVHDGRFREDLFHRLNVVTLHVPALRDRPAEVAALADAFALERGTNLTAEAIEALARHDWPGNVRELEHAIERASILAPGRTIDVADLPPAIANAESVPASDDALSLDRAMALPERAIIIAALERNAWNRGATARALGIDRTTLYKKMRRLGLTAARRIKAA